MAVGSEQISQPIKAHAERINLPPRYLLDRRAVWPKSVGIARLHSQDDGTFSPQAYLGFVSEAMARVNPAVEAEAKCVLIAVCIVEGKRTVEHFAAVCTAVVIGISEFPDVGNRPHDHLVSTGQRQHADGNVETIGKER